MEKSDKIQYMVGEKRVIGQEKKENADKKRRWIEALRTLSDSLTKERADQEARTRDRLNKRKITEVEISENEILRSRDLVFLPANGECLFIGDLHGDVDSLNRILKETKFEDELKGGQGYLVFLGDYLDRGDQELEVLKRLVELKQQYGERVILLRGNHEDLAQTEWYGGANRPEGLCDDGEFRKQADSFFRNLPCVLVTGNGICAVHGGIPQMEGDREVSLKNLSELKDSERSEIMWSDPVSENYGISIEENGLIRTPSGNLVRFEKNSRRGEGNIFSPVALNDFLKSIGAKVLIRSHESAQKGYFIDPSYEGQLVTVFSSLAGGYAKKVKNVGYCRLDLAEKINSWEEAERKRCFGSVSVEKTAARGLEEAAVGVPLSEAASEAPQPGRPSLGEKIQPPAGQEGAQTLKQGAETPPEVPPEAPPPEGPPPEETGQPPERQEEELLAVESPEESSEELVAIEKGEEEAKGKKEQEEAQRQTKEAELSRGFSFSGFINFLGDVILKPIEFIINLLDKTIDFLFMVKNFYDEYLKEDLKKIWKELLK